MATARTTRAPARRRAPARGRKRRKRPAGLPAFVRRPEVWGTALVVAGALAALGIYADLTGPFGRGARDGAGAVVGLLRWALPPALVWVGVAGLRGRRDDGGTARVGLGLVVLVASLAGLAHLARGLDGDPPLDDLRRAGGWLGLAVAVPAEAFLASWGAGLVLAVAALAALLVLTRTSPQRLAGGARATWRSAAGRVGTVTRWLSTLRTHADEERADEPVEEDEVIDLTGHDGAAEPEPARAEVRVPAAAPPAEVDPDQVAIDLEGAAATGPWRLPPLSLLERSGIHEVDPRMVEQAGRTLEAALAAHGVETRLAGMTVGPTVTRFELELGPGVKVGRVTALHKDIAYAMASPDVRILAPIPGRSAIGVEVPNTERQLVALGDILASDEARTASHPCEVGLGRDIGGRAVLANLADMPHLLIAGATGAGKSSCINSLITSLLVRTTPEQVRLILVDPKRVELGQYNGLPHLLTPVVVNPKKAANALSWAVKEMERRYDLLSEVGVRDITGYNAAVDRGDLRTESRAEGVDDPGERIHSRLPFIVVVVDELNDLMMVAARDVEESICRIAQMARAVGLHLVIATQRPSVNVITGVIKANIPARLAFTVSSLADSRVILDQAGAERLVGRGDMLILGPASSVARRIQGAWVGETEVRQIVAHWRRQSPTVVYEEGVAGDEDSGYGGLERPGDGGDDDLLWQAMELVVRSGRGSTSDLQRKLRVGFARAGRIMDLLEQRGVVGPSTGSKARDVLMTPEELDDLLGSPR